MDKTPNTLQDSKLFQSKKWAKILLINLAVVALLGCVMRLKLMNGLDLFEFKYVQHSHSHFAFAGWVSQSLMFIFLLLLERKSSAPLNKLHRPIFLFNLFCAYGMLISFIIQGYALFSIAFSFLSVVGAFLFAIVYWKDLNKNKITNTYFLKAALFFNMLSSFGTFSLAFIMASHTDNPDLQASSIYFFLHFQYNGWFLLACLGIFINFYNTLEENNSFRITALWLSVLTALSYSLSLISLYASFWLSIGSGMIAFGQLVIFLVLIFKLSHHLKFAFSKLHWLTKVLFTIFTGSFVLKLVLQSLSTYSYFESFAFMNRSIIVAYLHLIFLLIVTIFILFVFVQEQLIQLNRLAIVSLTLLISGFLLNELVLVLDGCFIQNGLFFPVLAYTLLYVSLLILTASVLLVVSQVRFSEKE